MPELPEVETIRRGLVGRILGKRVKKVEVFEEKSFLGEKERLVGKEVVGLRRFGKAMAIDCSGGVSVIVHLRMTGQVVFWDFSYHEGENGLFAGGHPSEDWLDKLPNKHTRVEIVFEDGMSGVVEKSVERRRERAKDGARGELKSELGDGVGGGKLFFNDQRKFGFFKVVGTEEVEKDGFIRKLAKEPWGMTGEELFSKLQRHRVAKIKTVILDQTIIAGLGNIYADEALYYAGVRPERLSGEVSREEAEKILEGARVVMERSIEAGGSSLRNYVKADGTRGDYLDLFAKVYGREGERCERCGGEIKKIKVNGRGSHFCPECQR